MSTNNLVKSVLSNLFGVCIFRGKVVLGYYNHGRHDTKTVSKRKYSKAVAKLQHKKPLLFNILKDNHILLKPSYLKDV